jgi:hypothetical protein
VAWYESCRNRAFLLENKECKRLYFLKPRILRGSIKNLIDSVTLNRLARRDSQNQNNVRFKNIQINVQKHN